MAQVETGCLTRGVFMVFQLLLFFQLMCGFDCVDDQDQSVQWWLRPTTPLSPTNTTTHGDGKSYATAWRNVSQVEWLSLNASGSTLFICGVGFGSLPIPQGLMKVSIDGSCPPETLLQRAVWIGGASIPFDTFTFNKRNGVYNTTTTSGAAAFATEVFRTSEALGDIGFVLPTARLQLRNCSDRDRWSLDPSGAYCMMADPASPGSNLQTVYYKPAQGRLVDSIVGLQLQADTVLSLQSTRDVTVSHLQIVGPSERLVDIVGGVNPTMFDCDLRWGSYSAITFNFKSATEMGVIGAGILNNTITASGCGMYFVNQGRSFDATANTNNTLVRGNIITLLDQDNVYGSKDNHAIGVQGGTGNVFERNYIDGVGGSCLTFYQGPGQVLSNTLVRYNECYNVFPFGNVTHNSRGIEYDNANALDNATRLPHSGNNSVMFNIIANVSHAALRSKAMSVYMSQPEDVTTTELSWSWQFNTVYDVGVFFETRYMDTSTSVHGDLVQNNLFVCTSDCKLNFSHHVGVTTQPTVDVYNANLYWPTGYHFCDTESLEMCTDLKGWSSKTHSSNLSLVAQPMFLDARDWPQGFRVQPNSPARARGVSVSNRGALRDFNNVLVNTTHPDLGAFVVEQHA